MPRSTDGNPVAWNGAAENVVDELDALTAFDRLHLDAADSELAVAAGLLFVFTFGIGFAANRFAIRDFGRLEREVDVVTLVQFGHDDFDVLLSGASEQEFLRLRIAREAKRGVLFENLVNRDADFVFVGARFGLDGESDRRLGNLRGTVENRRSLVAERFSGGGFF